MYEQESLDDKITASRIDMLLAIYDATIDAVSVVEESVVKEESASEIAVAQSRAAVLVGLIANGVDPAKGEVAQKTLELCEFVQHALVSGELEKIVAAKRVLHNLREGFAGIRAEASELELRGVIPRLRTQSVNTMV